MSVSVPNPSSRLVRAASAERAELARHRERLVEKRAAILAELRHVDDALRVVDQRMAILGSLSGLLERDGAEGEVVELVGRDPGRSASDAAAQARQVLRGPKIREVAVRVLISSPERPEALHYRRWYELVRNTGYAVAGKDPLAVFLTQLTRSPVVRKATEPGVYELDRLAPARIRERLERLQRQLSEVAGAQGAPVDLADVRARRHDLDVAISQQERALEEALKVLDQVAGETPADSSS